MNAAAAAIGSANGTPDEVQDEPDADHEESDALREARRARVFQLGRGLEAGCTTLR